MMKITCKTTAKLLFSFLMIAALTACHRGTAGPADASTAGPADVSAAGTTAEGTASYSAPTIAVGQAEARPGDTVSVPVRIMQSPGIAACRLIVEFDNGTLELQSFSYGEAFAENGEEPADLTSPVPFTWSQLEEVTGDELFAELTFRVKKDAEASRTSPVTVKYAAGDLIDIDENAVDFAVENGSVLIKK